MLLGILGLLALALPYAPSFRVTLSNLFMHNDTLFFYVGGLLLAASGILGVAYYFLQRHTSLELSMHAGVSTQLVEKLLQTYLQTRFPEQTFRTEAAITREGSLELTADMPVVPQDTIEKHLCEIEEELGALLSRSLNYQKKFSIKFIK
jgi:hypothetical protein